MAGIEFSYELEKSTYDALVKKLEELAGNKARTYIARALNKTAVTARVKLAAKAQASYTVKKAGFNSDMKIKNASAGNLVAEIRSQGNTLDISRFHWSNSRSSGVKVDVVRSGLKPLTKYGNKAFVGGGILKGKSSAKVYVRQSPARLPIEKLKSKSVPYMLGSENRVWGPMRPQIQSDLEHYMRQQIAMLVG